MEERRMQSDSQSSHGGVDRISGLHLPLFHHILSFLPAQDAVQTCVLSKTWSNIWCSMPSLDLCDETFRNDGEEDFCEFVDFLLHQRDGSAIQRFCLRMQDIPNHMSKVNAWIIYALRHNAQVIDIECFEYDDDRPDMELTPLLFSSDSLTELTLSFLMVEILHLPPSICLQALKVMHLTNVAVHDVEFTEAFFSSSLPSLETLILGNCSLEHHKLSTISARKLQKFAMTGKFPASLQISAPNLISLKLNAYDQSTTISFKSSLISLVDANIDVGISCFESTGHLFAVLKNTLSLTLGSYFLLTWIDRSQMDGTFPSHIDTSFPNLRRLHVESLVSGGLMLVTSFILGCCPQIESLTVDITHEYPLPPLDVGKIWSKCDLSHLKSVQIKGFPASEDAAEFVKHIVERATVLENLTFSTV